MPAVSCESLCQIMRRHTENVCQTMAGVSVSLLDDQNARLTPDACGAVMSLVGMTGAWKGTGAIACSGDLARRLCGKLLMTEFAEVDAEVLDAMGEFANMIIGNVKEDIAQELGPFALSTPTVIHGDAMHTRDGRGDLRARVLFACEGDVLEVRISLSPA